MSIGYYIIKDDIPVAVHDIKEWGEWMEKNDRRVLLTGFPTATISTVFLGIDHNFGDGGKPILYETMVFAGGDITDPDHDMTDRHCERYTTREDAIKGHMRIVEKFRRSEMN